MRRRSRQAGPPQSTQRRESNAHPSFQASARGGDEIWLDTADFFQEAGPVLEDIPFVDWVGKASTAVGKGIDFMLNWAEDDLLGTNTYAFSAAGLAAALPNRGTSLVDTRIYTDGDANYSLTMHVSRVV